MSTNLMTEPMKESSPRFKARVAGALWLLCIVTGMGGFIAGASLTVANDAAATGVKILANESSVRLGLVFDLISYASYLGATVFIYYVLKPVSRSLSLLAAFFGSVGVAIGSVAWAGALVPLVLVQGDQSMSVFSTIQLQAMSLAANKLQVQMLNVGLVFFGVHVASIGYLIARSTFLPRALGVFLTICGTSYVISAFLSFLAPSFGVPLLQFVMMLALIGEGSLSLWLLVKGVNAQRWKEQAGAPAVSQPLYPGELQPIATPAA